MNRSDLHTLGERELEKQHESRCRLLCCGSTPCLSSGGTAVQEVFKDFLKENRDLKAEIAVVSTGCMGPCSRGPLVTVQQQGQEDVIYERVTPELAQEILKKHVTDEPTDKVEAHILPNDIPFFTKQKKVVLANSGLIDPERLEDYVAHGGYQALGNALREMTPEEVCSEIINSGLRGCNLCLHFINPPHHLLELLQCPEGDTVGAHEHQRRDDGGLLELRREEFRNAGAFERSFGPLLRPNWRLRQEWADNDQRQCRQQAGHQGVPPGSVNILRSDRPQAKKLRHLNCGQLCRICGQHRVDDCDQQSANR